MRKLIIAVALVTAMTACTDKNPFLSEWDTPYGIPPYDQIENSDYIPAIKAGIEEHQAEIDAITSNPEAPTFENTIAAYDRSGLLLSKVIGVLFNVSETDRSEELDAVTEEATALLTDHSSNISFNKALYERIAAVYNADQSSLTREQQVVLKKIFDGFDRDGIGLPQEDQDRLREINSKIAAATQKVGVNILAESNAFKEKFGFSVSQYPEKMATTEDRDLRRQYYEAYTSRGHNDNENNNAQLALEILSLRIQRSKILGYDSYASYALADRMAGNPETVDNFLAGIMGPAVAKAKEEIKDMEALAGHKIEPWDWWYYAEKVRKAKYDLDDSAIRPYFNMDAVVNGIFTAAHDLYGINMEQIEGVPCYNPVVKTYKITAADSSLVGIFTTDYFPRDSKRGGAWMNNVREQYVDQNGENIRPIICNVGNLSEQCNVDEVQTAFHEFGHALHGLLSQCTYKTVSGTNVNRDFVEMFSQFNENWAFQPELLNIYAKNAEGEVIPAELVEKINAALQFNQGFMTTELCAASILDMKWHELTEVPAEALASREAALAFIDEFEKNSAAQMGLIPEITYRYRTTYFNHIFSSGYAAGYYSYLWAEVLDKDAFSIFEASENGVWDIELAQKFKETFLEKGGSEEPMTLYVQFAGREPDSKAMLQKRGLIK